MENFTNTLFLLDSWQVEWNVRSGQLTKQIVDRTTGMVGASLPRSPRKSTPTRDLTARNHLHNLPRSQQKARQTRNLT
jgi:hypothetical protein